MTETSSAPVDPRVWVLYDPEEDTGEVSLPGYLGALPSIIRPGDVFALPDDEHLDDVLGEGTRFTETEQPAQESPNAALTKEQLAEKLGDPELAKDPKPALIELADEHDRTHPAAPSEGVADVPFVAPFDAAVAEAAELDTPTPGDDVADEQNGSGQ